METQKLNVHRLRILLCVIAAIAAGCSVEPGSTYWSLAGVSPDEQLFVAVVSGGACFTLSGPQVTESATEVEIRFTSQRTSDICDAIEEVDLFSIELDAPLGNRTLSCPSANCTDFRSSWPEVGEVVATGDAVAVIERLTHDVYQPVGGPVMSLTRSRHRFDNLQAVGDDSIVGAEGGEIVRVDLSTGSELWRTSGSLWAVEGEVVYVCRARRLVALDAETGERLWRIDEPRIDCDSSTGSAISRDRLTVVYRTDDDEDRYAVVDTANNGELLTDEELSTRLNLGPRAVVPFGADTVIAGSDSALVVLSADGTEVPSGTAVGVPIGGADGVVTLVLGDRLIGYDWAEQAELWTRSLEEGNCGFLIEDCVRFAGGSVWLLDSGTVSKLDPLTGEAMSTPEIGRTVDFDVAVHDGVAYILTTTAIVAVDNETGDVLWSENRPR